MAQNHIVIAQTFRGRAGLVISTISILPAPQAQPLLLAIYNKLPDQTISIGLLSGVAQNQVRRAHV